MSIELPGKIEVRSQSGEVLELDCIYDSRSSAISWVCFDGGHKAPLERLYELVQEYMDLPKKERQDGDIVEILLVKLYGSASMCVPKSLFDRIPKYPHELVQQALAISE